MAGGHFGGSTDALALAVHHPASLVADALGHAGRQGDAALHVEELVLEGRAPRVEHQDLHAFPRPSLAWMAVTTTVLTTSARVQPRLRSFTGFARPWSTGPMATAPADRWTAL